MIGSGDAALSCVDAARAARNTGSWRSAETSWGPTEALTAPDALVQECTGRAREQHGAERVERLLGPRPRLGGGQAGPATPA